MSRIINNILISLLVLGVFGITIYLMFFSPILANNVLVMKIRYKYVLAVDKVDFLKPIIRATRIDDDNPALYVYLFQGKIEKADPGGLYMRGRDGKLYSFRIKWDTYGDGWVKTVGARLTDEKMLTWQRILMSFNIDDITKSGSLDDEANGTYIPYNPQQEYGIIWKDQRKLTQVLEAVKRHPDLPINLKFNQIWSIVIYE